MRSAKEYGVMVKKVIDEDPELLEITEQVKAADVADRDARVDVVRLEQKIKAEMDPNELSALVEKHTAAKMIFDRREQALIGLMKRQKDVRSTVTNERGLDALYGEENEIRNRIRPALDQLGDDLVEVRNIGNTLRRYGIPWDGPSTLDVKRAIQTLRRV